MHMMPGSRRCRDALTSLPQQIILSKASNARCFWRGWSGGVVSWLSAERPECSATFRLAVVVDDPRRLFVVVGCAHCVRRQNAISLTGAPWHTVLFT